MKTKLWLTVFLLVSIAFSKNPNIEVAKKSTLRILAAFNKGVSSGTAFAVSSEGYYLTNVHVVLDLEHGAKPARKMYILTKDGKYEAEIAWLEPDLDLALVKSETLKRAPLVFANSVMEGDKTTALGYPGAADQGLDDSFVHVTENHGGISRIIKRKLLTDHKVKTVQIDTPINHGNSGGPLVNQCGEVVGINESTAGNDSEGIYFAVHKDEAIKFMKEHSVQYEISKNEQCVYVDESINNELNSRNTKIIIFVILSLLIVLLIVYVLLKKSKPTDTMISRLVNRKIREKESIAPRESSVLLRPLKQGQPITVGHHSVTVGRSSRAQIRLSSPEVSGRHLTLEVRGGVLYVTDLGSTNGTYIDGRKLAPNTSEPLSPNQKLIIGSEDVIYMVG